jgi:RND family efflux transporter MFP subunit
MRTCIQLSLIGLAGLLAGVAGCEKAPAHVEPPPPKVTVMHPEIREMIDYDQYNGWLDAVETVEVRARVRGHIEKVHFTDGTLVKKGDLLFELDPRPFESEIGRQRDQKDIYQSQLIAAQKEEARLKELLGRGGASQSQVDKAEADAKSLEAQLKANDQEIKRRELDLEYSRITAPISGRISRAMLTEGNLVNAGGTDPVLTTIVSVDPVYIYFTVDERALQRYQKQRVQGGQTTRPSSVKESQIVVKFGRETDEGYPYEAVLDFADNQVDRTTGTILARAVMSDPNGQLTPGSRVRIRIPTSDNHTVALVPDTAILTDQDKKYLLALDDKNVVQRRNVNPGRLLDDGMRVILPDAKGNGVSQSDSIIVLGLQMARINYPVEPVTPATQPSTPGK